MSYDYNDLVAQIVSSRQHAAKANGNVEEKLSHLQQATELFSTLSSHCPMTPLLWMQYASDTMDLLESLGTDYVEALETRLSILQLGLSEFPGSAPLHVHYLQLLSGRSGKALENKKHANDDDKRILQELEASIVNVGRGSHRNEGDMVASIYRMAADLHLANGRRQHAIECFCQRAGTPMKDVNDGIVTELEQFLSRTPDAEDSTSLSAEDLQRIEACRLQESKIYGSLITWEDEIDIAMNGEGVLYRHLTSTLDDSEDWKNLLRENHHKFWMGFGGITTANAFIKYAQFCGRFRLSKGDEGNVDNATKSDIEDEVRALALPVYERGVAECPTVESLWLSYITHLHYLMRSGAATSEIAQRLQNVVNRAVRNCPYSIALYKQRLGAVQILAEAQMAIFDPDRLMKIVQDALDSKFVSDPTSCLDLYLSAIQAVKRRILVLLSSLDSTATLSNEAAKLGFDDPEAVHAKSRTPFSEMDESTQQDVQDLCEDIREMYDTVDSYLRKSHTSWAEGRAQLWNDRGHVEKELLSPLMSIFRNRDSSTSVQSPSLTSNECTQSFEKLVKIQQPAHPDSFRSYIHSLSLGACTTPIHVISRLRQVRGLFQRALKTVGKPKETTQRAQQAFSSLDYETSLRCLCHEYLVFETHFGSEYSLNQASMAVQKKLAKALASRPTPESMESTNDNALQADDAAREGLGTVNGLDSGLRQEGEYVAISKGTGAGTKRKHDIEDSPTATKKSKPSLPITTSNLDASSQANADDQAEPGNHELELGSKSKTETEHKVRIGNLEYPAHPLTVRVSNLSPDTLDMDLVDSLRPKCGAIVHARIAREKHHHGKGPSKGWALVQFEERNSVDKALELSDVIGIREKLIKVERSHVPAVGLVPPGMHRVNPKGEGKSSKRNLKRKERKFAASSAEQGDQSEITKKPTVPVEGGQSEGKVNQQSLSAGILAFRPRGVGKGRPQRKVKLEVVSETKQDE